MNANRLIAALAAALAVIPAVFVAGVPKWVVFTSALSTFLGVLVKPEQVMATTPKPLPVPPGEPQ